MRACERIRSGGVGGGGVRLSAFGGVLARAGLRHLARHPWQTGLAILGVALGVAVVVATDLASASARRAFGLSAEAVTGRATHQVVGGPGGLDERVYARIRDLADHLREGLRKIPKVTIISPAHPDLCCATTTYRLAGLTGVQVQDALWDRSRVRVRSIGEGVRHCCHIYNTMDEVNRSLLTLEAIAGA